MKLSTAMEQFLTEDCRDRQLASATIYRYRSDIRLLVSLAAVEASDSVMAFTPRLVRSYFRLMSEKDLMVATLHRRRAALSEFAKWGLRQRLWAHDPMAEIPQIKRPKRLPRAFRPEERTPLLALRLDRVDRLLRALLYYTGLRVTPLSLIRLGDISDQPVALSAELTWPGAIRTIGKGNKEHVVPMHPDLADIIRDFALSSAKESGLKPSAFLLAQTKSGKPWSRKMIEKRTKAWGTAAGVDGCTPHRFRHTFVTVLLEAGVPLEVVSKLAAHEDVRTTMLYAEITDQRKAAAILQMPTIPRQPDVVTGAGSAPGPHEPSPASEKSSE